MPNQPIPMSGGYVAQTPASQVPAAPAPQPLTPPAPAAAPVPMSGGYVAQTPQPTTPQAAAPQPGTPPQTGGPQQPALTMPATGSVVDLLNMAGQDASFAARKQMAQQFGIQGYTGTANQNQELAKKFLDFHNQKKGKEAPASASEARSAVSTMMADSATEQRGPADALFFDALSAMNPIERSLFEGIAQTLSPSNTRQTFMQLFQEETAKAGIPGIQMELASINKIMDGTEDDIRTEIQKAGGFATESQIRALTGARNKTLLREAQYLSDMLEMKKDYVDQIVALTKMDRDEVDKEIDRKLGISEMLLNFSDKMETRARENYRKLIDDAGYDGLVGSITSQAELERAAKALGMTPKMLMQMSKIKTPAQRRLELDELNFNLSVDKFEEDKRQFGLQYALEEQKFAAQNAAAAISATSLYSAERSRRTIDTARDILMDITSEGADGARQFDATKAGDVLGKKAAAFGFIPGSKAYDFKSKVEALQSQIAQNELTEMREASKTGGALGNASDKDMDLLKASLGNLSTWQSPTQFYKAVNDVIIIKNRWNAVKTMTAMGLDYDAAIQAGWTDEKILEELGR